MFMLYGPNTNLGHNSVIAMMEAQYGYILQALDVLTDGSIGCLVVRQEVMHCFNETLQHELRGSAWLSGCTSWYKTASGKVVNNWSGSVEAYKENVSAFNIADYEVCPAPSKTALAD
jgi:hypothetical protein